MTEGQHLAEALERYFNRTDNGWFTPFTVAMDGLTAQQAVQVPAPRFNCVWAVVNHVSLCQEIALLWLRRLPVDRKALGAEDDWPPPTTPPTEQAWQAARDKVIRINQELVDYVAALSDAELDEPLREDGPTRCHVIQGVLAHNSYHTSEIISIRHYLEWWVKES
jgi:hypothetical protein